MVPPSSDRIHVSPLLVSWHWLVPYGAVTHLPAIPGRSGKRHARRWPGPRSLATTDGVSLMSFPPVLRCFSSPGSLQTPMDSGFDTFSNHRSVRAGCPASTIRWLKVGFPIRRSSDQSSFAAPQGLSQRTTSFIASQRQGIHQMLLRHLIALMIGVRRDRQPVGAIAHTIHGHDKDQQQALSNPLPYACRTYPSRPLSQRPGHIPSSRCQISAATRSRRRWCEAL